MGEWYPTVKRIKGRYYLYEQRTWREGPRVRSESRYIGPLDPAASGGHGTPEVRRKRSNMHGLAMAVFGVEDDYGRRVVSLWNRYVNKEQATIRDPQQGETEAQGSGAAHEAQSDQGAAASPGPSDPSS